MKKDKDLNSDKKRIKKQKAKKLPYKAISRKATNKNPVLHLKESQIEYSAVQKKPQSITVDGSWDFKNSNTKEYTHCFHPYPAMMIPQVARRLLDNYGTKAKTLFDPYCGTGTSLVEANLKGINAIGTDINPLARLIASAKTAKIDILKLESQIDEFNDYLFRALFKDLTAKQIKIPKIKNIDFWFSKTVQLKLGIILSYIEGIKDKKISDFFKVAFSETVRESSFVKPGEFKLVRRKNYETIPEPDIVKTILSKLSRNKQGLIEFYKNKKNSNTHVYDFNTVLSVPKEIISDNRIDIVITSPPYGDSRTTVAYGQYSRLANEWLGFEEACKIDNTLMGGIRKKHYHIFKNGLLNDVIAEISRQDKERARDVISFYEDYDKSIKNVAATLHKGAFACYVVGNRTVKGMKIPTDEITAQLFQEYNFEYIETFVRNIPNKRMPSKNSPSNVVGETASTMKNEYIVVCQKK